MAALLTSVALLVPGGSASAAIYWAENGNIVAARLDGGGIEPNFFRGAAYPSGPYYHLLATDTHLYWRGFSGVMSLSLDGPAAPPAPVVSGINESGSFGSFGVGGGYVFWTNPQRNSIGRAALDGSHRVDDLITVDGYGPPGDIAVHGDFIYWDHANGVARARLDGSEVDQFFVSVFTGGGVAVDGEHIYWGASGGGIGRADLDGSDVEREFIPGVRGLEDIAALAGSVYWVEQSLGPVNETIGRALPGLAAEPTWIQTPTFAGGGVAVDARPVPVPRALPSRSFTIGKVRRDRRRGTIVIDAWVADQGELVIRTRKVAWKVLPNPSPAPGGRRERIKVWAGAKTNVGRAIRAKLNRDGLAGVNLQIAFTEPGQLPAERLKHFVLSKKLPRKPARLTKRSVGHHR